MNLTLAALTGLVFAAAMLQGVAGSGTEENCALPSLAAITESYVKAREFAEGFADIEVIAPAISQCVPKLEERGGPPCSLLSFEREIPAGMSREESMLLGGWSCPTGNGTDLVETLALAKSYWSVNGRWPRDGRELVVQRIVDTINHPANQGMEKMTPVQKLGRLMAGINPVTGGWFESFDNPQWHASGIYFEHLDGDQAFRDFFRATRQEYALRNGEPVPTLWRITVFGTEPGKVLFSKIITSRQHPPNATAVGVAETPGNPCQAAPGR